MLSLSFEPLLWFLVSAVEGDNDDDDDDDDDDVLAVVKLWWSSLTPVCSSCKSTDNDVEP